MPSCLILLSVNRFPSSFAAALSRQAEGRFRSAQEMRDAWRQIFARVDEPAVPVIAATSDGEEPQRSGLSPDDLHRAQRDTPLAALGLSARALNALSRADVLTVENLLALPVVQVSHMRGVGNKTRKEIMQALTQLGERFAALATSASASRSTDGGEITVEADSRQCVQHRHAGRRADIAPVEHDRGASASSAAGLPDGEGEHGSVLDGHRFFWPSQTEVAEKLDVTRARVGQIVGKARGRWQKLAAISTLRDEIAEVLRARGG